MKLPKGVIFIFLALIFKVAVAGNSTKVYMLELEFEESVHENVTDLLKDHTQIDVNGSAIVTNITSTTNCILADKQKNCSCMTDYTWSEDICRNHACCKNENCEINVDDPAFCLSEKRVSINGSTILTNNSYNILVSNEPNKNMEEHKKMEQEVITMLKKIFSTLEYFDSLIINGYGRGSVIVYYTVQILGSVTPSQLVSIIKPLNDSELTTTGLVTIVGPEKQPIDIGSNANINCTPSTDLGEVRWYLTDVENKTTQITTGNEASFQKHGSNDSLHLGVISGSWKGTFTCVYAIGSIKHTASITLDIALLPEQIQAMSTPQFPDCTKEPKEVNIVIECIIPDDKENYTVTWTSGLTEQAPKIQKNGISYEAKMTIQCADKKENVTVDCTFTNNRATNNKARPQSVVIPIIQPTSAICEAEGDWPKAKSNHTAIKSCINSVGLIRRECKDRVWGNVISSCVNKELDLIQKRVENLNKGIGLMRDDAEVLFEGIQISSTSKTFNSYANINASVHLFKDMNNISMRQENPWNDPVLPNFVKSASNVLNDSKSWKNPKNDLTDLAVTYLQIMEEMVNNTNMSSTTSYKAENFELQSCNDSCKSFNASVDTDSGVIVVGFRNLYEIFPNLINGSIPNASIETTIMSVIPAKNTNSAQVVLKFNYSQNRLPNHDMYCVFWDETRNEWSSEGCVWGGVSNPEECRCDHNSAFTIMMAKDEITLPYMEELTYAGLGLSIVSLVLCLIIEILIWDTVVKSDISNFRHVAIFNICLCLLFAHIGFLASAEPKKLSGNWCSIITLVKHFFFLAVFFWMLCLSFLILHQIIFVFDHLRKKVFWGLSITLGYVCPVLCVAITFITFRNGEAGAYYSTKTCWLIYEGVLKGSMYAFILPVGTIVFINLFTLVVVIMKIVTPTMSEAKARDEKDVAKSMIKTIVFLSPVLGITWILGFFVMHLDLTQRPWAQIVNYTFTILNSLQGFFILLTNCVGEKKVRDALRKRFRGSKHTQSAHSKSESSTKETYTVKNK
ncbi:adhesion G protein-coupled receptor F4 [Pimephales promelas]|nr:adhesion G protein-coupled receptor F4 [Pimephales promelas]KAG1926892.1 adhesion G protein-coupled receptor F4 [Pimephales promelas]